MPRNDRYLQTVLAVERLHVAFISRTAIISMALAITMDGVIYIPAIAIAQN